MLVPQDMIGPQSKLLFQVNKFYGERVHARKYQVKELQEGMEETGRKLPNSQSLVPHLWPERKIWKTIDERIT